MSQQNPFPLTTANQVAPAGSIIGIIWTGATTAGDTVVIRHRSGDGEVFWEGRADSSNTYKGAMFAPFAVPAKGGLVVGSIATGTRVLVYYRLVS